MSRGKNIKGQIWVETVIYTLIAFAMIGLALAFIKPKIDDLQDKAIIEQSISILEEMNSVINEIGLKDAGNQRLLKIGLSEGELTINASNNELDFELTGGYAYSEPGKNIGVGNVDVLTEQIGELYTVHLSINYSSYDILYENGDVSGILSSSPTPYSVLISKQTNNVINMEIIN